MTEPLVQRRGTRMGSVRVGEQQEHWSGTSSVSMEYRALLVHLPCNGKERGGNAGDAESQGGEGSWGSPLPAPALLQAWPPPEEPRTARQCV